MGDYIDRYSLLNDLKTSVVFSGRSGVVSSELKGANKVIDRIIAMPTEDVKKVKHGEWLEKEIQGVIDVKTMETTKHFICSVCCKDNKQKVNNYCPNCGAKMDGDV